MANKVYYLDRDGATPQVVPANTDEKLKVYDDFEDIDTTDLVDGEIVSTKENGVGGNVYDYVQQLILDRSNKDNLLSEWEDITLPTSAATAITMDYDGYLHTEVLLDRTESVRMYINGAALSIGDNSSNNSQYVAWSNTPVKKGDVIYVTRAPERSKAAFYKQRYYGGRN
jgi:hypothetical protein